jgi:hypothetical protein
MPGKEQKILETTSGEYGHWEAELYEDLEPGFHQVKVLDEFGNDEEGAIFVNQETVIEEQEIVIETEPQFIDRVTTIMPLGFLWVLLILFLIILILGINTIRLGRIMHKQEKEEICPTELQKKAHRMHIWGIAISIFLMIITFMIGVYVNYRTNAFTDVYESLIEERQEISVTGSVHSPLYHELEEGLDLTVRDTTVRIQESGAFSFSKVDVNEGIRMNHPELRRSFMRRIDEVFYKDVTDSVYIDISYDTQLYNLIVHIADLESRSKRLDIYELLHPKVQEYLSKERFLKDYTPFFYFQNLSDQVITIGEITSSSIHNTATSDLRFTDSMQVPIYRGDEKRIYTFVRDGGEWYLLF